MLVVIVAGALIGNYLGIMGVIDENWFWFGNQGLSYLELGRFWQILFFVGLLVWSLVLLRAFWPTLKSLFQRSGRCTACSASSTCSGTAPSAWP